MEHKPLIDYSQPAPKPRSICPVSVGIVVITVALVVALLYGLDMRGVL